MAEITPTTRFAPAERAAGQALGRQSRLLEDTALLRQLYDAVTDIVLILNPQRQIVFCNKRMADVLGVEDRTKLYGLRPGEALGCVYAGSEGGCGTSEFCEACGAVNAVLASQAGAADARECAILRNSGQDSLDLLIRATPLEMDGERFTIVSATDIRHEKRRRALERTFFHDLMNTAMGLKLFTRTLATAPPDQAANVAGRIRTGIEQLLEEVEEQRDLAMAENHELAARSVSISSGPLLDGLVGLYGHYAELHRCSLVRAPEAHEVTFASDPTLLSRVLGNMVKNAVEASEVGRPVTLGCRQQDSRVEFWVHNHGAIPPQAQLQIFRRSFTTKGPGRGLGTYSMKLLTERYLKGAVSFTSSPADGTTFTASCPLNIAP